jgi:hypothetical protein
MGIVNIMTSLIPTPKGIGHDTYRNIIAAATAAYSIKRRVPTIAEIAAHCSHQPQTISKVLVTEEFKELMRLRGFPFDEGAQLTPAQVFAVGIITDPTNRKDLRTKLKQAGITYATYRAWLKQPHFAQYITQISEQMLNEHVQDVHTKVVEKAAGGDIQAMRLYYELTGRHDPQKQQMVDLNGVIGLLLEVITRYVTDTTALSKITQDIDLILSGGTPRALEQFDMSRIIDGEVVELEPAPVSEPKVNEPIGDFFSDDSGVFDDED